MTTDNKPKIFEGPCKGGPWNGKMLSHYAPTVLLFQHRNTEKVKVYGHYHLRKDGWLWKPSEEK